MYYQIIITEKKYTCICDTELKNVLSTLLKIIIHMLMLKSFLSSRS